MHSVSPSRRSPRPPGFRSERRSATPIAVATTCATSSRTSRERHDAVRARGDRADPAPPGALSPDRRGPRPTAGGGRRRPQDRARRRVVSQRPLPRAAGDAGRAHRRSPRANRSARRAERRGEPRPARALRRHRRVPLQAHRRPGRRARAALRARAHARTGRAWEGRSPRGGRARLSRNPDFRGGAEVIGKAQGAPISITGLGAYVPSRIVTNDELSTMVDTNNEWIMERTGIRERRIAAPEEAFTDLALPAAKAALEQAELDAADLDLLLCATVTPDMMFPTSSALLADTLGAKDAAAYDLLAGCTGFMYALVQAYGMMAAGLADRALVVGGDVLSRILDWTDRSTVVLFGDGAGAVVLQKVDKPGFLGFELGADGGGGIHLSLPGSGSRRIEDASDNGFVHMNGREVFKFATRVLVSSAEAVLERCGVSVEEVDLYVPHQANVRIMDHAAAKLGIPRERMVVNVDRYGNTSSGSIPLALAEAQAAGRLKEGDLVLMTGMGAGLTWGSALMEWTG